MTLNVGPSKLADSEWTGLQRVARERLRQVEVKRYGEDHDDAHTDGELMGAAIYYTLAALGLMRGVPLHEVVEHTARVQHWPWQEPPKIVADPVRNLEKAGALIVAEIDRLKRLEKKTDAAAVCDDWARSLQSELHSELKAESKGETQ